MSWVALDIGGANLKAADGRGFATSRPFPLWTSYGRLATELAELLLGAPDARRVAVTMTGELADCFETKSEGVLFILDCVEQAAGGRGISVYLVSGDLVMPEVARRKPHLAAASNWHALAAYCCRYLPQPPRRERSLRTEPGPPRAAALLVDVGSTTTDIVPLSPGGPLNTGSTDVERLVGGELVYTGIRRSPICAVVDRLPWRGGWCPIAQEVFATTADVYVLLEELPENAEDRNTADGRPLTRSAAHARMARMYCLDRETLHYDEAVAAAAAVRDVQLERIREGFDRIVSALPTPPATVILSGEGEFLARQLVSTLAPPPIIIPLSDVLSGGASRVAPAYALAVLASEREESTR